MLLEIKDVCAGYGDLQVLFNISMHVNEGEVVSLVGSNGAGKTTLLRILSGLEPIKSGIITFCGKDLMAMKSYERADYGIAHIPQGRGILGSLTVKENLVMGAYPKAVRANMEKNIAKAYEMFPILNERKNQLAGSLSGGEQQMLAISRALMIEPKLLMLDEPSLGLAPIVVKEMFNIISEVAKNGVSILIVEQNLKQALSVADRGYVIETGSLVMEDKASDLLNNKAIQAAYLGI
ncbi:ABC transporter ATP-binding protein [Anaerobium acetethylicum]|uniref:Branched-chain amino acid transport system ATP-binding protein n=1 Tax=Anaerobium acetethylicum TaxID=1619234 RepID=A0A1D3TYC5_9FIRM|nr:ABC transporter ATP-binding protein [Anaerobium acetethylicum]SCP99454.1 branched-chain amino acid transport system ATP-binding protein [Anaerobium acetethylicum]